MGLRHLACWDCGFESRSGHGCLSLVECWVLSGRGLCDGPIIRAEDPIECDVSVIEKLSRGGLGLLGQSGHEKKFKVIVWHAYNVLKTSVLLTLIYCLKLKLPGGSQNSHFLLLLRLLLLLLLFFRLFLVVVVLTDHVGWSGDASAVCSGDGGVKYFLEFRSGHRLYWNMLLVIYSSPSRHILRYDILLGTTTSFRIVCNSSFAYNCHSTPYCLS